MKINQLAVERMRATIAPLDTEATRDQYRRGDFPHSEHVKDLDKRYRWDLYWSCGERFAYDNGVNDSHIDTALRAIVKGLAT